MTDAQCTKMERKSSYRAIQFSGRRPSHHTGRAVLADGPPPLRTTRQFPRYDQIAKPEERRHERWCLDIRYIEKHHIPEIKGSF